MIIVLEKGHLVECGPPHQLLKNPAGTFSRFVRETGAESAAQLVRLAAAAGERGLSLLDSSS